MNLELNDAINGIKMAINQLQSMEKDSQDNTEKMIINYEISTLNQVIENLKSYFFPNTNTSAS